MLKVFSPCKLVGADLSLFIVKATLNRMNIKCQYLVFISLQIELVLRIFLKVEKKNKKCINKCFVEINKRGRREGESEEMREEESNCEKGRINFDCFYYLV